MNKNLRKIVLTGLLTALVFLATSIIKVPFGNGGYIHFGDAFIFLSVMILGPFYGAFASGVGSMLADLLSPYAHWALPTLIVKSVMALIMGLILQRSSKKEIAISGSAVLLAWIGFIVVLKNMLHRLITFSPDTAIETFEAGSMEEVNLLASKLQWTLTAIIVGGMILVGALLYWVVKKKNPTGFGPVVFLGMISAGAWMIIGYYFTEIILYGNAITPIISIPINLIQLSSGIVISVFIAPILHKAAPSLMEGGH